MVSNRRYTLITLPNQRSWPGLEEEGRVTGETMLQRARSYAQHLRRQADLIDAATSEEFQIEYVRGSTLRQVLTTIQQAKEKTPCTGS